MTLYKKRDQFLGLSKSIGKIFSRLGLSPNQWTFLSIIPALISVYFLASSQFLSAALFILLAVFLDMVDGAVARHNKKASKLGAYVDTVVDRYVEAIIIFGLLLPGLPEFYLPAIAWVFLYFFGGMMTTYAKSAAKEKELSKTEIKGGLIERAERMLVLLFGIVLASISPLYLVYVIAALAVLTNISAIQRIVIAVRSAKRG